MTYHDTRKARFGPAAGVFNATSGREADLRQTGPEPQVQRSHRSPCVARCRGCKRIAAHLAMPWQQRQGIAAASISSSALLPPLDRNDGSSLRSASAAPDALLQVEHPWLECSTRAAAEMLAAT
jgi:hypothetical protein